MKEHLKVCAEEEHWKELGGGMAGSRGTLQRPELSDSGPPASLLLGAPIGMPWLRTRVQLVSLYAPGPVVITNGIATYMADCRHSQELLAHR